MLRNFPKNASKRQQQRYIQRQLEAQIQVEKTAPAGEVAAVEATPTSLPPKAVLKQQMQLKIKKATGNNPVMRKLFKAANDPMAPPEVKQKMEVAAKEAAVVEQKKEAQQAVQLQTSKTVDENAANDQLYVKELVGSVKENTAEEWKTQELVDSSDKAEVAAKQVSSIIEAI